MERTKVGVLGPGWKGEIPQDHVEVYWALRTSSRRLKEEVPTANISMESVAANPDNIAKPQKRRERVQEGDTGKAGKEDLMASMLMVEIANTDAVDMRATDGKREGRRCDTVPGSECPNKFW